MEIADADATEGSYGNGVEETTVTQGVEGGAGTVKIIGFVSQMVWYNAIGAQELDFERFRIQLMDELDSGIWSLKFEVLASRW